MKSKALNILLILTSLIGYLEWGKGHNSFLFEAEAEIISKLFSEPTSVAHPFTVIPLAGQLVLFLTLFQKRPNKTLTFIGIGCIGVLLLLMFVIAIIGLNYRIFLSTIPFIAIAVITINHQRTRKRTAPNAALFRNQ